jgi:hypothetical protein
LLLLAGCTNEASQSQPPPPAGPSRVRAEVVAKHGREFDGELAERVAGSQQEFAASSYITGHLQQGGYEVKLDPVPVGDLVRSTNVIALPPGDGPVSAVVAIPYDTTPNVPPQGEDLGLFLELARALRVADPDHNVEFVALGAEYSIRQGGHLGSRRLASALLEDEEAPVVVTPAITEGGGFASLGPQGDDLNRAAQALEVEQGSALNDPVTPALLRITKVFHAAGFDHAIAAGGIEEIGEVLLDYLQGL